MIAPRTQKSFRACFVLVATAVSLICAPVRAQDDHTVILRGQVLNSVTKEPVPHALVTLMGEQYAMFTDDQGRYEFQIHSDVRMGSIGAMGAPNSGVFVGRAVNARKPGFLDSFRNATSVLRAASTQEAPSDVTIYLVPEALIVGQVDVHGSEGEVRIECELYRKEMRNGRQVWSPSGASTTWANGEFRFSGLRAGTYKLITHEQMDRDSLAQVPGAPLFGYPPVYYPNTTDFSAAGEIAVTAGQTAQVNLAVARHEYYPVQIPTRNAPVGRPIDLSVWPMGHWGPGWSLGFNPGEQTIEGLLPNGNYTVEANSLGEQASAGIANFSVKGRPAEGPSLLFVPNPSIRVAVRREFHADQSASDYSDAAVSSGRSHSQRAQGLDITLSSLDDFSATGDVQARPVDGSQGNEYTIPGMRPGLYQVKVDLLGAYAAAIESGGKDLMHEPLAVPLGGAVPTIEITLRDDGAEIDGTVNDSPPGDANSQQSQASQTPRIIYLVPAAGGQPHITASRSNGNFSFRQVPPGDYLILAISEQQQNIEDASELLAPELQGKGQPVHLEAGQKINVTLNVIDGSVQ